MVVGYTAIALDHTIQTKFDPKMHENVFERLFAQLRKREGILYIKRLTIVMDDESDKGNGLVSFSVIEGICSPIRCFSRREMQCR